MKPKLKPKPLPVESTSTGRWVRFTKDEFEVVLQAAKLEEMTVVSWIKEVVLEEMDITVDRGPFNLKERRATRKLLEQNGDGDEK